MKYLNTLIILTLIFSMLTSCKATNQETPTVLNHMCGKLCWSNIVVGVTSQEELVSTIRNLSNIDQSSISESRREGLFDERIYFSFHNDPNNEAITVRVPVYLIDQKVVVLDLNDNLGTNFQEVIDAFGEPELVAAIKNQGGQVSVSFINSSEGVFFSYVAESEKSNITPDTDILRITLFDVALYQELLEANWLLPGYRDLTLHPWRGYGKIEEYYWPPR